MRDRLKLAFMLLTVVSFTKNLRRKRNLKHLLSVLRLKHGRCCLVLLTAFVELKCIIIRVQILNDVIVEFLVIDFSLKWHKLLLKSCFKRCYVYFHVSGGFGHEMIRRLNSFDGH